MPPTTPTAPAAPAASSPPPVDELPPAGDPVAPNLERWLGLCATVVVMIAGAAAALV